MACNQRHQSAQLTEYLYDQQGVVPGQYYWHLQQGGGTQHGKVNNRIAQY